MEHSISKDLLLMLTDADDHNVIIQVGENQNTRDFRAHSNILRARSHYFQIALSKKWVTKRNNEDVVKYKKPNIDPGVFEIILRYIYTDEADLSEKSGTDIFKLLIASDELLLEKLFKYIQDYLIENRVTWIKQNFDFVFNIVFKYVSCKKLQEHCLASICEDPHQFFSSKNFPSLDKNIFYSLLKRADLHIDEVIAWNHLIKWGINQIPLLKSDIDEWNETDYEDLKKAISQFIPLIRFSEISRADFYDNVRPYKAVIPHNVYEEMMKFYMKDIPPISIISTPRVRRPLKKLIKAQKPFLMKTVKGSVRWNPY
ncbi:hypothetical protein RhiirA4_550471 [Rhizophagus irregularis]|uniref:BTB domain-containing protein n=1 Tax=Rhizophagus irregularis TaxID=588596 RepID=A0A2I1HLN2_9GLOM|nr:hypothetical protein RhiirA4_546724 [Rhizophagus irregularis]PKY59802.1 hypothetical protein RhiirA4_550471 [Rhizophagus irregularis]